MTKYLSLLLLVASFSQAKNDAIKIILNNWSSQIVVSHILGGIYKNQGFKVEYVTYPTDGQWYILKHNIAHVQVEVWQGTMADKYALLTSQGKLIDAGDYNVITREEWWYPEYVEQLCPGLPDWQALNACSGIFSQKDNLNKGIYYGGPWEKPDKARVRALNLNFKIINANTAENLWKKLATAYKTKQPIVLFNWTPNWVGAVYKGKFVEFPEHQIECETIPKWGLNPDYLFDCGNPKAGWLKKVSSTEFPHKWPCAFRILQQLNFTNSELEVIAALVDLKGLSYQRASQFWLNENKLKWHNWLPSSCNIK